MIFKCANNGSKFITIAAIGSHSSLEQLKQQNILWDILLGESETITLIVLKDKAHAK